MAPSSSTIHDEDPVCSRGRRDLNDPFFLKGYQVAWRADDGAGVAIYYVNDDTTTGGDITAPEAIKASQNDGDQPKYQPPSYPCGVLSCSMTFPSLVACDEHYEVSHMFQCHDCHAILPSDRLLDLHLQEAHDNFFLASVERGTHGYACLVCDGAQFPSIQDRLSHLMVTHGYPKWFRFVPQAQPVDEVVEKKKHKWIKNHEQSSKAPMMEEEEKTRIDATRQDAEARQQKHDQRRERQKQKNARIPCRFHLTAGGCWRGDKCMFRHGESGVDNLTNDLVSKAKVSVPDNISFGRKR
jgi:hypothetical protein